MRIGLTLLLASSLLACNPGADTGIKGSSVETRDASGNSTPRYSGKPDKPTQQKPTEPGAVSPSPTPGEEAVPIESIPISSEEGEGAAVPGAITGAYLYCSYDSKKNDETITLCNVRDGVTRRPIKLADRFRDIRWSAVSPDSSVPIVPRDISGERGYWHAEFKVKAVDGNFERISGEIQFKLSAVEIGSDRRIEAEDNLASKVRTYFRLQSQQPHGAEQLRCLDFSLDVDADRKGMTGPCNNNLAQRFHFGPDNALNVTVDGQARCVTYDPGNMTAQYLVPKACNAAGLPRPIIKWNVNDLEFRIQGQNLCMGLTPDQPDPAHDYIGMQNCNGSNGQRWSLIPYP